MITIAELLVEIGVEVEQAKEAEKKINDLREETDKLGDSADKSDKKTKSFASGLGKNLALGAAAAAAAIAAASAAIFSYVTETTAAIDATNKLATALGVPIEELQRLQFAAERSGVEGEKLNASVKKLNTVLLQLGEGVVGPASDALGDLGLSFKDLEGLTTTDQLGLIGERLQEVEKASERSAIAALIFGEDAGPSLASLLAEGRDGLEALGAQANNVFTQEQADQASAFQDELTNLSDLLDGIIQPIALELVPTLIEGVEIFQDWIKENQEFIDLGVDLVFTLIADVVNAVWSEFKLLVAILKPVITFVADLLKRVDEATGIFKIFRRVITAIFNPLNTLIDIVETVILGLEKLGLVSEGTSARFGQAVDKMVADSSGFDTVRQRADDAGDAVDDLTEAIFEKNIAEGPQPGTGVLAEDQFNAEDPDEQRRNERRARREARAAARAPKRSGGGGGAKRETKEKKKAPTSTITAAEIFQRIFQGRAESLAEDLKGVAAQTPDVRDVQPTVAISIFNIKFESGAFQITGSDPLSTATEVAVQMERQLRGAAQSLALLKKR